MGDLPVQFGVFLETVDMFDAGAFGISTPEAAVLDPQQRLILEAAAEVLQSGGSSFSFSSYAAVSNRTSVFVGISSMDYNKVGSSWEHRLVCQSSSTAVEVTSSTLMCFLSMQHVVLPHMHHSNTDMKLH